MKINKGRVASAWDSVVGSCAQARFFASTVGQETASAWDSVVGSCAKRNSLLVL
jgi:hypothetical protein